MLARIAHELYWLGRSLVRAEHTARMLDGVWPAELQGRPEDAPGVTLSWPALLAIMGADANGDHGGDVGSQRDRAVSALMLDPASPISVVACVGRAREGARTMRDVISAEMWEAVNTFHLGLAERGKSVRHSGPYALSSYVKANSALFWGVTGRTMLRDEAYAFLQAGGRLEAADMVLRMLRVALPPDQDVVDGSPLHDGQALALLHAVGGLQAYRRAVPAPTNAAPVARFLLFTRNFPDSVAASVESVRAALVIADENPRSSEPVLRLSRLAADLEFRGGGRTRNGALRAACELVGRELSLADRDISERYFGSTLPHGHRHHG
jgi:uncharacterized alpha-E superfamily protein